MTRGDQDTSPKSGAARTSRRPRFGDRAFRGVTMITGVGMLLLLVAIVGFLWKGAQPAFSHFGLSFFTGTDWTPVTNTFGALPYIFGTLVTSVLAVILAVPIAVGLAILLNEPGHRKFTAPLTTFVDMLAAIPSVIFGLWGLTILVPVMEKTIEPFLHKTLGQIPLIGQLFSGTPAGGDFFTAGVILAIMILPIITAISREVIAVVPRDLREAAKALGATRYETIRMGVLPYARPGIVGATMLGLGRALGETIAVSLVIGGGRSVGWNLFASGSTIPSTIASQYLNAQAGGGSLQRPSLLALGLILVVVALAMAAASRLLVRRTKELVGDPTVEGAAEVAAFEVSG